MPAYSDWDVQKSVYGHLAASTGVTSLLAAGAAGVHDHVPEDSSFPYIALGEMTSRPLETADGGGRETVIKIHVFSRAAGLKETRSIMAAVHVALHDADFSVAGHALVFCLEESAESLLESDGITRHGTMAFRIVTEPAA